MRVGNLVIAIGNPLGELGGTVGISSAADISAVLDRHSVGDVVKVVVSRSGREITVNIKLTEQKPQEMFWRICNANFSGG